MIWKDHIFVGADHAADDELLGLVEEYAVSENIAIIVSIITPVG